MNPTVGDFATDVLVRYLDGQSIQDVELVREVQINETKAAWFARDRYHVCICTMKSDRVLVGLACSFETDPLDTAPVVSVLVQKLRMNDPVLDVLCIMISTSAVATLFVNGIDHGSVIAGRIDPRILIIDSSAGPHLFELRASISGDNLGSLTVPVD
jgi:hypothetical protein